MAEEFDPNTQDSLIPFFSEGEDFTSLANLMKADQSRKLEGGEENKVITGKKVPKLKGEQLPLYWYEFGLYDPRGIRRKFFNLSFDILRRVADQVVVVGSIHNKRASQIRTFSEPSTDDDKPGWKITIKDQERDPSAGEKKAIKQITQWFDMTGFKFDPPKGEPKRRPKLADAMEMLVRDLLTIDQVAVELRKSNGGQILDWHVLDAATIFPVDPRKGLNGDMEVGYVQMVLDQIVSEFGWDDLLFDFMNKRSDVKFRMFGYSPLEQSIDTITAFLFATAYNRDQFSNSAMPKGFFSFDPKTGTLDREQLEELQRQWMAMFGGIKGMWKTPFLQYGARWNNLAPANRDMEYTKYMDTLQAWICSIYKIDPSEVGLRFEQSSSISIGNSGVAADHQRKASHDAGVKDILFFLRHLFNKIMAEQKGWEDFEFVFTGVEIEDKQQATAIEAQQVSYRKTINEIRALHDDPPIEGGDIILNPTYVQFVQQNKQMEQQQQMMAQQQQMGGQPGQPGQPGEEEGGGMGGFDALNDKEMGQAVDEGVDQAMQGQQTAKSLADEYVTIRFGGPDEEKRS